MPTMLRLLGTLGVEREGPPEPVVLDRPVSLLAYLAVRRTWVPRTELAFLYRPDESEVAALRYLRKVVFRARSVPWAEGLEVTEAALRWIVDTDLHRFRVALGEGAHAEVLRLYGGPFLGGASLDGAPGFGAWQELQRDEAERGWTEAARGEAHRLARAGRHSEAARVLARLLEHDPLDEEVVQAAMSSLAAAGRRREALRVYDDFARALADEVDGSPLEGTDALADDLRRAAPAGPPAVPAVPGSRFRLPTPATGFVGRARELAAVTERLVDGPSRLVTLVGLGGSGKTRLALEAAVRVQERFADGGAHVSLAGTASADRVAAEIVERLGLPWVGASAEEALGAGLADRQLLLLLDEFEGVVDAAALLVRLLERAPRVVVLVTSREALEVRGEQIVDVSGLEAPPEGETTGIEGYDAVQLFVGCAARVAPDFFLTRANLAAVAEICRELEGLPLAIEMAASWIRTLPPENLRSELAKDGRLLKTRLRDVPERQSSLLRILDYSCARLPRGAREALPRLTVFRGGFTLEAAEAVARMDLDGLLALMNRTFVRRRADGRYAMHALVRQYALLNDARDVDVDAHARYFADRLARLTPDLKGRDPVGAVARIDADLANFEAAWDRAVATADVDLLDACRDALDHYWHYHSRWHAAAAAFARAVAACEGPEATRRSARLRARLLVHLAGYERALGDVARARGRAAEALPVLMGEGSASDVAHARLELASCAYATSSYEEASALYLQVLEAGSAADDRYLQGAAHNGLANVICAVRGDMETAEEHDRASLDAHSAIGNLEGINGALINLGACRYDLRDFEEAGRLWTEAAVIARRLGYAQREAVLHNNLGSLAESTGDPGGAAEHYERSLTLRREVGDRRGVANVLRNLGRLAHAQERFTDARAHFAEALTLHDLLDEPGEQAQVRSSLARTLAALGRAREAEATSAEALRLALVGRTRGDMLAALATRSELRERAGDLVGALRLALYVIAEAEGSEEVVRERAATVARRVEGSLPSERAREIRRIAPGRDLTSIVAEEAASRFGTDPGDFEGGAEDRVPARPTPAPRNADGTPGG